MLEVEYHCTVYCTGTVQFYLVHYCHSLVAFTVQVRTVLDCARTMLARFKV